MHAKTGIPIGYIFTVLSLAYCTWKALLPKRSRRGFSPLSLYFGPVINELPFLALLWLFLSTFLAFSENDIYSVIGWTTLGFATLTALGLAVIIWRSMQAVPKVVQALDEGLGRRWQNEINAKLTAQLNSRFRLSALLGPFLRRRWDVKHIPNISYGDAGKRNLLDIYLHRSQPLNAPVLIHFHGGAMVTGKKNREALPLLYRLASKGWICISANYRLQPTSRFPAQLIDAKKVIAWARTHISDYGADASSIFVAGGSAGGQLATQAALTPNDPRFQPGFENLNTSVAAAISLYGYYGWFNEIFLQQLEHFRNNIPPMFVVHGDMDTLTPVETARHLVAELRKVSSNPVVYAELPHAQHNFDLFHSIRNEVVIDGIEAFAAWVIEQKKLIVKP